MVVYPFLDMVIIGIIGVLMAKLVSEFPCTIMGVIRLALGPLMDKDSVDLE